MEEKLKKYGPMAVIGAAIVGGIYYLSRNSSGGTSTNNAGYSVVNPPDNSAAVAAAASMDQSRLALASTGLQTLASLTAQKEDDATKITLSNVAAKNSVDLSTINANRDITLQQGQLTALDTQSKYSLAQSQIQNDSAIAIQKEQDDAAIRQQTINANTQNNAIKAQQAIAHHNSNVSMITSFIGLVALVAMCYDQTDSALGNRRIYTHGDATSYFPGENDKVINNNMGPAFRTPKGGDAQYIRRRGY